MATINAKRTTSSKEQLYSFIILFSFICFIASIVAVNIPIEKILQERAVGIPFFRNFPWYSSWRVAVVNFLLWVIALILVSFDVPASKYFLWLSTIIFLIAHYFSLHTYKTSGFKIFIYPFIFVTFSSQTRMPVYHLDLGQIILLISLLQNIKEIKSFINKRLKKGLLKE